MYLGYVVYMYDRDIADAERRSKGIDYVCGNATLSYWLFNPRAHVSPKRPVMIATDCIGCRCSYCWKVLSEEECEREHVIPVSKGGPDRNNVVPVCKQCNRNRSNKSLLIFFLQGMQYIPGKRRKPGGPYWKPEHSIHYVNSEDLGSKSTQL